MLLRNNRRKEAKKKDEKRRKNRTEENQKESYKGMSMNEGKSDTVDMQAVVVEETESWGSKKYQNNE